MEEEEEEEPAQRPPPWEPDWMFGVAWILSMVVLFFAALDPQSGFWERKLHVWKLDERLSLRSIAGPVLAPQVVEWPSNLEAEFVWQDHENWATVSTPIAPETCGTGRQHGTTEGDSTQPEKGQRSLDAEKPEISKGNQGETRPAGTEIEVGINMSLIPGTGWGHLAYEVFFGLLQDRRLGKGISPIFLGQIHPDAYGFNVPFSEELPQVLRAQKSRKEQIVRTRRVSLPVLHAIDHEFFDLPEVVGSPNIAIIFFDSANLSKRVLRSAESRFDAVIVGSSWNSQIVRERGLRTIPVHTIIQGVDTSMFYPRSRTQEPPDWLQGRYVIFSGGKFELRKAQDIVVGGFRRFKEKHPQLRPILLFSWHNPWPFRWHESGVHTNGKPQMGPNGKYEFSAWLSENGVSSADAQDLGHLPQVELAEIFRNWVDVAVFPNRCEGGTNLVAMEAMATGVPSILSQNTGHLDLIHAACPGKQYTTQVEDASKIPGCLPLSVQRRLVASQHSDEGDNPYNGWGESDPDEIVRHLEIFSSNRRWAQRVGQRGAQVIRSQMTWSHYRSGLREVLLNKRN